MTETKHLKLFVKGSADVIDASVAKASGGAKLDKGVAELAAEQFPHVVIETVHESPGGTAALRTELESGESALIAAEPDIVLLSVMDDVAGLPTRGANPEEAVQAVRTDLVAAINLIKEKVGAHVLITNVSTVDTTDRTYNYHGHAEEPVPLRIQRLDLMLIGVSNETGISIVDVDRLVAEMGAAGHVGAAGEYDDVASARIAAEIVRIIDDYGFFDDRPLLAQVGATKKGAA